VETLINKVSAAIFHQFSMVALVSQPLRISEGGFHSSMTASNSILITSMKIFK